MRFLPGLLCAAALFSAVPSQAALPPAGNLSRTNLVAWCIVPFDSKKRGPEERAAMLANLGIQRLAYDWRAEHIPTFDAEVDAMRARNIEISAWWFPAALNAEARAILECIERKKIHPQLWITMGTEPEPDAARLQQKLSSAVATLAPLCAEARRLGCTVALYNHLGWFGEPANQVEIIKRLQAAGHTNVGIVYNFHHAHDHIGDFAAQLEILKPHLLTLNLNGMVREGDRKGRKIIPLGTGDEDLNLLRIVHASGWKGPIGIIGHTDEDAEVKLRKELAGLEKLAPLATRGPGEPAVSGREPGAQGEGDWVDNRWQTADIGHHLAATFRLPDGSTLPRGLALRLGSGEATGGVAYDLATATLRAAWTGGFVRFDPARFGLIGAPRPDGQPTLELPKDSHWQGANVRFQKLHVGQNAVVLEYTVNGTRILETPGLTQTPAGPVFTRTLAIAPHPASLTLPPHQVTVRSVGSDRSDGSSPQLLTLHLWNGPAEQRAAFDAWSKAQPAPRDPLAALVPPAPEPTLATTGQRGLDTEILAVDTLTFPYDNPAKALFFASGVDLTPDGTVYTCTIHGDVWRLTGVDDSLRNLRWQRFATGLYQPLGLKVRNGQVFVLGRDHITRLHDRNADGVAEEYEAFFTGIQTSSGGHDYVTCLETDTAGRFYYADPKGVHRVAADGSAMETLATGFRNPNGMGVRPDGKVITVAPQQGDWTPSSGIWEIHEGLYGGWGGPRVTAQRTNGYDAPLCWIPHGVDKSSGSQVWIPEGQWGPLGGQMLHLLWGRCGMMLALRDTDPAGTGINGAVVALPAKFLSGPNRATFNPADNSLLVAGSTGWQTSAVKDGAVQRVRFTGKPVVLPIGWKAVPGGVEVRFSQPVDPATAQDPGSYSVRVWNYRYAQQYGSKDWLVSQPDKEGREDWNVKSATVQSDGHSVRLEIPGIRPVMQGELKYNVDTRSGGKPLRGSLWFTLNRVR